jgi:hypothetical protein
VLEEEKGKHKENEMEKKKVIVTIEEKKILKIKESTEPTKEKKK